MDLLPDTQNCGCACAGNAGNVFPVTAGERSRHASRHVRHARAVRHAGIAQLAVSFEFGGGGKRTRHSRRMRNLQFYVSGKRPMVQGARIMQFGPAAFNEHRIGIKKSDVNLFNIFPVRRSVTVFWSRHLMVTWMNNFYSNKRNCHFERGF